MPAVVDVSAGDDSERHQHTPADTFNGSSINETPKQENWDGATGVPSQTEDSNPLRLEPDSERRRYWDRFALKTSKKLKRPLDPNLEKITGGQGTLGYFNDTSGVETDDGILLTDLLHQHDEAKIERCNADMDTLLVFAGLLSAILATVNIDSYKTLQQDPSSLVPQILSEISQQLNSLLLNSSASAPSLTSNQIPFNATKSSLRINALWFASLVCSLITASLAMSVKQWLREYLALGCSSTEERIRIRHVRYEGLLHWRVFEIASFLPLLLQVSLILFFIGLSDFLRSLNPVVGWFITGLIVSWFVLYAVFVFSPMVSASCPYKTPFLNPRMQSVRGFLARLRYGAAWRERMGYRFPYYHFPGDERGTRRDATLDLPALIGADKTLVDDVTLSVTLRNCVGRTGGEDAVQFTRAVLSHRFSHVVPSLRELPNLERIPTQAFLALVNILVDALGRESSKPDAVWKEWITEAIAFLSSALYHADAYQRYYDYIAQLSGNVLINLLCSENTLVAQEVLTVLATGFPPLTWSLYSSTADDVLRVAANIISAAQTIISTPGANPVRLCRETLNLMDALSHTNDYLLTQYSERFADIQCSLTDALKEGNQKGVLHIPPFASHYTSNQTYIGNILSICNSLNATKPDCIKAELIDILKSLDDRSSLRQTGVPKGDSIGGDFPIVSVTAPIGAPSQSHYIPSGSVIFSTSESHFVPRAVYPTLLSLPSTYNNVPPSTYNNVPSVPIVTPWQPGMEVPVARNALQNNDTSSSPAQLTFHNYSPAYPVARSPGPVRGGFPQRRQTYPILMSPRLTQSTGDGVHPMPIPWGFWPERETSSESMNRVRPADPMRRRLSVVYSEPSESPPPGENTPDQPSPIQPIPSSRRSSPASVEDRHLASSLISSVPSYVEAPIPSGVTYPDPR